MAFELDGIEHSVGDRECGQCWTGFPVECECGGLVHAEFGDENKDCEYWLWERCDKCEQP